MLISGMYDLEPVRLSKRSEYVKFTDAMEQDLSAMRHVDGLTMPVIVAHGSCETPEISASGPRLFRRGQSGGKAGRTDRRRELQSLRDFPDFTNPYGLLGRAMLRQMGLK